MKHDAFGFLPKIHFFVFLKKIFFIFLALPSKHPHLRLDKFTRLWAGTQRICNTFCRPLNVSTRAEARHAVAPMFFFAKTWHPSAFVKVSAFFLQAYFSETIQIFKNRSATECPFWPCKKIPKIFRLGDFISFENTIFAKIFRIFSDFAQFYHLNHIEPSQNRYQLTL